MHLNHFANSRRLPANTGVMVSLYIQSVKGYGNIDAIVL